MTARWLWFELGGSGDRGSLVAVRGPAVELELWMGGGWTATRARGRLQGSGAVLGWVVAGEA